MAASIAARSSKQRHQQHRIIITASRIISYKRHQQQQHQRQHHQHKIKHHQHHPRLSSPRTCTLTRHCCTRTARLLPRRLPHCPPHCPPTSPHACALRAAFAAVALSCSRTAGRPACCARPAHAQLRHRTRRTRCLRCRGTTALPAPARTRAAQRPFADRRSAPIERIAGIFLPPACRAQH